MNYCEDCQKSTSGNCGKHGDIVKNTKKIEILVMFDKELKIFVNTEMSFEEVIVLKINEIIEALNKKLGLEGGR